MSINSINRRRFLQSAMVSGLLAGGSAVPGLMSSAQAAPARLRNRLLANLNLGGGPDMRHLIAPAYNAAPDSYGNKYWKNRARAHGISTTDQSAWKKRWEQDYYPITVGNNGWHAAGLVDPNGVNSGTTFGIWREAGWLIDMFRAGNVALIFNAAGGTNRAHDHASLILAQGNVLSGKNDQDRSGWGGRLARVAGGRAIGLTRSPSAFCFGPKGAAPGFDPNAIDNVDLLSVKNSRSIGLFDFDIDARQYDNRDDKMARAAKSYYAGLRNRRIANVYQKFMDHERKIRTFGDLIGNRLETVPVPTLINALYRGVDGPGGAINPEPNRSSNKFGESRRVLHRSRFGEQIRNFYDMVVTNDLINPAVLSLGYGDWDSHSAQRKTPSILRDDPTNPYENRGIESGFRDIFGGKFGASPSNNASLHGAFSALWASLPAADTRKIVLTIAGEFGRQLRDNGDGGTDHGKGNMMLVIGEGCAGGVYGEIFPDEEVDKYDDRSYRSPDIDPRTDIDEFFAKVCDWVKPNAGDIVFPRQARIFSGEAPRIETGNLFSGLMR